MLEKRSTQATASIFTCLLLTLSIIALPCVCIWETGTAWGDAGGFAGSSDYGDSGGSGSSYSYDDDDDDDYYGGSSWWDDDDGDDGPSYTSNYHSDYKIEDDEEITTFLGALVVLAIVVFILYKAVTAARNSRTERRPRDYQISSSRGFRDSARGKPSGASVTPAEQLQGFGKLQQRDPGFYPNQLEELVANLYVRMQQAWTAGDLEPLRPYFDNKLFSQFSNQLAQLNNQNRINHVDNIAVLECRARGWYEDSANEHVVMKVRTRITDYTVDNATGAVVSGFKDRESFMEYEYTLSRSRNSKTGEESRSIQAGQCPNCGAPINLAQSARCDYCGTVVESREHSWVISEIRGVSQQIR